MKDKQIEQEHIAFEHALELMRKYRAESYKMRHIALFEMCVIFSLALALIAVCVK